MLLEAAQLAGEAAVSQKKMGKKKGRARAGASGAGGNNCTVVDGSGGGDDEGTSNGGVPSGGNEEDKGGVVVMNNGSNVSNGKKRRSPAVLMEGSRCSRVNGRGWRCSQQTLVGYSLCEHHLGKGRLRSMNSVKGQIGASTRPKKRGQGGENETTSTAWEQDERNHKQQWQEQEQEQEQEQLLREDGERDEEKMVRKKIRKKIGTVKARSISSLLDEGGHPVSPPPEDAHVVVPGAREAMV